MKKGANILMENVVFIVINVAFFAILLLFLAKQGSATILVEEAYAKQIALLIDSAKPGMHIKLNIEKLNEFAKENNIALENMIVIQDNQVNIKLNERGGYSYSFFNDVNVGVPSYSVGENSKGEEELFLNLQINENG